MDCCVCGGGAGKWTQHWNRDDGYSICPQCVSEEAARLSPEELRSNYGLPGVNYDRPTVKYNGRRYRVLASTFDQDVANRFIERTPGATVLMVFPDNGRIVIADRNDEGTPITESSTT